MTKFDWNLLSNADQHTAMLFLRGFRDPDLVIAPDGNPYLYRWHVTPPKGPANVYLHVQVADDPERPLHDHPWDNTSVILSGGYKEIMSLSAGEPQPKSTTTFYRSKGDVIFRRAAWPHRLFLLHGWKYTMTLFTTGPKVREWGFWYPRGWIPYTEVTRVKDGKSVHIHPTGEQP
jgi:hypothetical protein